MILASVTFQHERGLCVFAAKSTTSTIAWTNERERTDEKERMKKEERKKERDIDIER